MRLRLLIIAFGTVCLGTFACSSESGNETEDENKYDGAPVDEQKEPTCDAGKDSGLDAGPNDVAQPKLIATLFDRWQESWLGSPAVADIDQDGTVEILVPRSNLLLGWHMDGSIVFRVQTEGRIWASPVVADLDPDKPGLEIAVASRDKIYAWDSAGNTLDGFPFSWRDELRTIAAGDINGDGLLELVSVTTSRLEKNGQRDIIIAINRKGNVLKGFPPNTTGSSGCDDLCSVTGGYDQTLALGDVNGDGKYDIFTGQDNSHMSLHHGDGKAFAAAADFPSTVFPGIRFFNNLDLVKKGWSDDEANDLQAHSTNSAPAIADIDGDGKKEIIILTSTQNASQADRLKGVSLFVLNNDGSRPNAWTKPFRAPDYLAGLWDYEGTNVVAATTQVTVADISTNSNGQEMIFAGFDGKIHAVSADAKQLWEYTYTTSDRVLTGGVLAADLSADGFPEIIFTSYSPDKDLSHLFILSATGAQLYKIALPDRGSMAVPTVADTNGDGTMEIIISLKDAVDKKRQVLIYSIPGSKNNCLLWPTGRANLLRNGYIR